MAAQRIVRHRASVVEGAAEGHDLGERRKHHRETAVGLRLKVDSVVVGAVCRGRRLGSCLSTSSLLRVLRQAFPVPLAQRLRAIREDLVLEHVMRRGRRGDAGVQLDYLALERFLGDFASVEVELAVPLAQLIDRAVALA